MRRFALWTFFIAVLLIVVPVSFDAGERYQCEAEQQMHPSKVAVNDASTVSFDPCTMWDAGMLPWMRWSFDSGILMLCVSAWMFWRGREKQKKRSVREIHA